MTIEGALVGLLWVVLVLVILVAVGWALKYIIDTFLPEPMRMLASVVVGVLLLVAVVLVILRFLPSGGLRLR